MRRGARKGALRLAAAAAAVSAALLVAPERAAAQSVLSLRGPGVGNAPGSARGRALGGVGLALADTLRGAPVNPALGCFVRQVTFSIAVVPEMTRADDGAHVNSWRDMTLAVMQLHMPLHPGCVAAAGLRVDRSRRAEIGWEEAYETGTVKRHLRREGDVFAIPLTLSFGERRGWSGAFGVEFLHSSLLEVESWKFSDGSFPGTTKETSEGLTGAAPVVAFSVGRAEGARLGFVYRAAAHLHGDRKVKGAEGTLGSSSQTFRHPSRLGVGASLRRGRTLVAGDFTWEPWGGAGREGGPIGSDSPLEDAWAWGIGIEREGSSVPLPFIGTKPLRLGFRQEKLPVAGYGDGTPPEEHTGSVGTGWVFGGGRAAVDVSLELGFRGSVERQGARERLIRLVVGVAGREPWKKPERRGVW